MPILKANGLDIFYDEFGRPDDPALVLIMGLNTQMVAWPEEFCRMLAGQGFRVIRFDNRDIGLSTKMEGAPSYNLKWALAKSVLGLKVQSAYSLDDMAKDTVGLLDALGIDRAHIVGASMGGMIAQIVAARYPERVLSLVSMMSTSGKRGLPGPTAKARAALFAKRPAPGDREGAIRFGMTVLKAISSPGYPTTDVDLRGYIEMVLARSVYPPGYFRQLLAVLANGSRVELLKTIIKPTLVLHGEDDPLVPIAGGRDTANHIAEAKLETIPGWGHDLPRQLLLRLADVIAKHCSEATLVKV